jgi:hypothetical protein
MQASSVLLRALVVAALLAVPSHAGWSSLGAGPLGVCQTVAIDTVNDLVYAGGNDEGPLVSRWNGTSWEVLGNLSSPGTVRAVALYQGKLYVAGDLPSIGNIGVWNDTAWVNVGKPSSSEVQNLIVYQDKLIAANFTNLNNDTLAGIVAWDGLSWELLGQMMISGAATTGLLVYKDTLYMGCEYYVKKWDGVQWSHVAPGTGIGTGLSTGIRSLAFFKDTLYAGGTMSAQQDGIRKFDGTAWVAVAGGTDGIVSTLYSWNDALYAGGQFSSAGGVDASFLARYDGASWQQACGGVNKEALVITEYKHELLVGGAFDHSDATTVLSHLGVWNPQEGVLPFHARATRPAASIQPARKMAYLRELPQVRDEGLAYDVLGHRIVTETRRAAGIYFKPPVKSYR